MVSGIQVESLVLAEAESRGITSWPIWTKDVSRFDWQYDAAEVCYLLDGRVTVETDEGRVEIGAGQLVRFPAGLACMWEVHDPVRKHYRFES